MDKQQFAARLRVALLEDGLSIKEFAQRAGTDYMSAYRWTRGTRSPSVANLAGVLDALPHTPARWLICGK